MRTLLHAVFAARLAAHAQDNSAFDPVGAAIASMWRTSAMRRSGPIGALAMLALLAGGPAGAQDLYIGTVAVEKDVVVLTRCDLAQNRYRLRDRRGSADHPVADLRERLKTLKGPVYVEVIGAYAEEGEDNALDVIGLENLKAGKSCHLTDALAPR